MLAFAIRILAVLSVMVFVSQFKYLNQFRLTEHLETYLLLILSSTDFILISGIFFFGIIRNSKYPTLHRFLHFETFLYRPLKIHLIPQQSNGFMKFSYNYFELTMMMIYCFELNEIFEPLFIH